MAGRSCLYQLRMKGLSPNMDEDFIRNNFLMVGIKLLDIVIYPERSYAVLTVENEHMLDWILNQLRGYPLPLCPLKTFEVENTMSQTTYIAHVSNMSRQIDDYGLYCIFKERYLSVVKTVVVNTQYVQRRYGIVQFTDESERDRAVEEMTGVILGNKTNPISVKVPAYKILPAGGYSEGSLPKSIHYSAQKFSPITKLKDEEKEDSDEEEIDPNPSVDYDQANKEFFAQSQQLFLEMERTFWQPLTSIGTKLNSSKTRDALHIFVPA